MEKKKVGPLDPKREVPKPNAEPKFVKGVATPTTKK